MSTYEMLWDCRSCDSKKLLGKSHRHCPNCGQAQDPSWRYFPPEDEKVAVEDHVNVGVDWICPACDSPNARVNEFCGNCGAAHEDAKSVELTATVEAGTQSGTRKPAVAPQPPEEPTSSGPGCGLLSMGCIPLLFVGFFGVIALFILYAIVGSMWTSDTQVTVVGHSWERSIEIETLRVRSESDWCDDLPKDAMDVVRSEKKKSTKKVADGEDCKKINVDNGDGTMTQKQKCTPKFREDPVMAPHCSFKVQRWATSDTLKQKGDGFEPAPTWPTPKTTDCTQLGCTRAGKRKETYTVKLVDADNTPQSCEVPEKRWRSMAPRSRWKGGKSVLTGALSCGDLKPE